MKYVVKHTLPFLLFISVLFSCSVHEKSALSHEVDQWQEQAARVTIIRDDFGVPHIYGKTDADAVFGLLYAQCEDDFNRVERNYLWAIGRLAEVEGEEMLYSDLRARLFMSKEEAIQNYENSPEWLKALCRAYADGINYYLYTHPEVKPKLLTRFEPWMPMYFSEGSIGGDIESISTERVKAFYENRKSLGLNSYGDGLVHPALLEEPKGSNGFSISGKHTESGNAMLLINPHTSFFFRGEVHAVSEEGLNAYGAVTWGQFFIYQGFNEKTGWMHTSAYADVIDEFEETIVEEDGKLFYQYGENKRPVTTAEVTLSYKDGGDVKQKTFTTYRTHHGPITHQNGDKCVDVYKLQQWTQGPVMLQALNVLENFDLKGMGYNSTRYIHTLYQAMNLTFADRDFYYGDSYFAPQEPMRGLLSKEYAKQRASLIGFDKNNPNIGPGDPYPFEGSKNPYLKLLKKRGYEPDTTKRNFAPTHDIRNGSSSTEYQDRLWRGTTTMEAADKEGWVVSITPSGGWLPATIAGNTGIGMSQRMQSFVLDAELNPFNVVAPGKRPRVTLTPSMALKDGKPFLSFAVQGGDTQDQNLLQFFLNVVEFDMNVQQAAEAANFNTNQLWLSLGGTKTDDRKPKPGHILLHDSTPEAVRNELKKMGYTLSFDDRTSGPINAIYFDWKHGSFWGGSSNHGEDYGIGW